MLAKRGLAVASAAGLEATARLATAVVSAVRTTEEPANLLDDPAARSTAALGVASAIRLNNAARGLGSTASGLLEAAAGLAAVVAVEQPTQAAENSTTRGRSARIAAIVDNAARGLAAPATVAEQAKTGFGILGTTEQQRGAKTQRRQNGTTLHGKHSSKNRGEGNTTRVLSPQSPNKTTTALPAGT